MKIQIVIPCINLWNKYTKKCIESVKSKHEIRIMLIDNASSDETKVEAGKMVSSTFSHHRNEQPWSCAKSWNFGIKDGWERGYDCVAVLNNDVLLHPDCLDRMIERFEKNNTSGDITKEIDANQHHVVMVTAMDVRGNCDKPDNIFEFKSEDFEKVSESEHPNFSTFMVNKEFWDKIGEFDEEFNPAYFEDNSCHYKIKLAGLKAVCYPPALFYHFGSRTWNEGINQNDMERGLKFERNKEIYVQMWGGIPGSEIYKTKFNK